MRSKTREEKSRRTVVIGNFIVNNNENTMTENNVPPNIASLNRLMLLAERTPT
jgi:hypothetical protein